jgi:hypothetical protein
LTDALPSGRRDEAVRLFLVVVQLLLLLALVRVFELENRTVYKILGLAFGGFVVHALLPNRFRLPFFAALSVVSVPLILGLKAGAIVLSLGFLLIGACRLPVSVWIRTALLLLLGVALFVLRGERTGLDVLSTAGWAVLGSMFMFRLALYFYSVRYHDAALGLAETAAYLFMLPNVVFPLFPVVDYKTFVRSQFDSERFRIYDRGIRFILRGVTHLLLYRYVYYEWAMDERYVNSLGELVQYVVSGFVLYLKVSGLFHLTIGVLCLYGFRLPETNHLYFLSSSFTDLWRRINIYWKDFMMKLVYYPSFFRLRRYGNRFAMATATVVVFVVTWVLHWYQAWWLTGWANLFSKRDAVFWGILGALVVLTTLWEARPSRRISKTRRNWRPGRAVSTVATILVLCVLWSLWNMRSPETWLFMWTQARHSTPTQWVALLGLLAAAIVLAGFGWGAPTLEQPSEEAEPLPAATRRTGIRLLAMGGVLALTVPSVRAGLPVRIAEVVHHVEGRGDPLIAAADVQRGYYEQLTPSHASDVAAPWRPPVPFLVIDSTSFYRARSDFLLEELAPSRDSLFHGKRYRTNAWGMRDREYALAKSPSTFRIAMMGPSYVAGYGVADGEPFEAVLESQLDSLARHVGRQVEILDFGMDGYSLAQSVYRIDREALRFTPDLIVLAVSPYDLVTLQRHIERVQAKGIAIPDTALGRLLTSAGFGQPRRRLELRPFEEQIDVRLFQWAREIGARVRARVVVAAFGFAGVRGGNLATNFRAARQVGMPVLDCSTVFNGRRPEEFRRSEADGHPSAAGHRVIARCLSSQMEEQAAVLGLDWVPWTHRDH